MESLVLCLLSGASSRSGRDRHLPDEVGTRWLNNKITKYYKNINISTSHRTIRYNSRKNNVNKQKKSKLESVKMDKEADSNLMLYTILHQNVWII